MTKYATSGEKNRAKKAKKEKTLRISPNPVDCLHSGAFHFGAVCCSTDVTRVHVECWRAHFKIEAK